MKKVISLFLTVCLTFCMFVVISATCSLYDSQPDVLAFAAEDNGEYDLNWDEIDLTPFTDRQKDETPEATTPIAPIIVIAVAGIACVALGAGLAVQKSRRKAK